MKSKPAMNYPTPDPELNDSIWKAVWERITDPAVLRSMASAYYDSLPLESKSPERERAIEALCRKITEGDEPQSEESRRVIIQKLSLKITRGPEGEFTIEGAIPVASPKREVN